jgi:hypothetical protein
LKGSFETLRKSISLSQVQTNEVKEIYNEFCELINCLMPGQTVKVVPIGSFLLGCMRKDKLEIDCFLLDIVMPRTEVNLEKLKEGFEERKSTFLLVNSKYQLYEAELVREERMKSLVLKHTITGIKVKMVSFLDEDIAYTNKNGKVINYYNSAAYHTLWMEDHLSKVVVRQEFCWLLQLVRHWRDKHELKFPSEIIDLSLVFSTFNFKEFDTIKVLLKFFALVNMLINDYNYYFYDLSEYHSFIIKVIST